MSAARLAKHPAAIFECGCAVCDAHRVRRTEVAMSAHVLAKLLVDGLLRSDAVSVAAACRAAGVAVAELQAAWRIVDTGRYVNPNHLGLCVPDVPSAPHAESAKATTRYRQAHDGLDEGFKRCPRCETAKPIEAFGIKDRRSGRRKSMCRACAKDYQAERYVKIGYKSVLVEVMADDPCVGHRCPECDKPFEVGQIIVGERVIHFACSEVPPAEIQGRS